LDYNPTSLGGRNTIRRRMKTRKRSKVCPHCGEPPMHAIKDTSFCRPYDIEATSMADGIEADMIIPSRDY
jgi:hypothetical protein